MIQNISQNIDNHILILFWQFTIRTIEELDIVSNQNLSIEMFLMRLIYISSAKKKNNKIEKDETPIPINNEKINPEIKKDTVEQIKNISQEEKIKPQLKSQINFDGKISISSFEQLLKVCTQYKEIKLKYELEKNVNLVSFEKNRIEISFNDNLDKNFVKDLSLKLFEWTGQRWIITFTKKLGEISIKEKKHKEMIEVLKAGENSELFKRVLEKFPDANLINVTFKEKEKDN